MTNPLPAALDAADRRAVINDLLLAAAALEAAGLKLEGRHGKGTEPAETVLDLYDRVHALIKVAG